MAGSKKGACEAPIPTASWTPPIWSLCNRAAPGLSARTAPPPKPGGGPLAVELRVVVVPCFRSWNTSTAAAIPSSEAPSLQHNQQDICKSDSDLPYDVMRINLTYATVFKSRVMSLQQSVACNSPCGPLLYKVMLPPKHDY
eukprot:scaffold486503_cov44-Prasinocladus_malaysianus.AAC.1